jgi:hypothetical protein
LLQVFPFQLHLSYLLFLRVDGSRRGEHKEEKEEEEEELQTWRRRRTSPRAWPSWPHIILSSALRSITVDLIGGGLAWICHWYVQQQQG